MSIGACTTFVAAAIASAAPPPLVIHGDVISNGRVLASHAVIVRDGVIDWVGPERDLPEVPPDAEIVEAEYVIPGLVDAHVHLFDRSQLDLYVVNGVTTVLSMTGSPMILDWQRQVRDGELRGPDIFSSGPQIKDEPLPIVDLVVAITSPADAADIIELSEGYDFVKIWSSLRPDIYDALLREASKRGLRVTGHVPSRVGLKGALASGQGSVAHLEELLNKFFLRDTAGDIAQAALILNEADVPVITTLMTYDMIVDTLDDDSLAKRLARD